MPEQKWFCESCRAEGVVRFENGAGVYEVFSNLGDDHRRISPDCETDVSRLRAVNKKQEEIKNVGKYL